MAIDFYSRIEAELSAIREGGLMKPERVLTSPQGAVVRIEGRAPSMLNLCANNYIGLAADPRVVEAAIAATREWGAGLASVRFICGTQAIHKQLESAIAAYLGYDDAILFAAAFDANGGVFEPLLGAEDAIVSDTLNHASIIDGIRLSKAKRYRYATSDIADLERVLTAARADGARTILIATDGVFSMDGAIAPLDKIAALAERFGTLLLVDDCHATGLLGQRGRGSGAYQGVADKVDILTGTFGKALGGAMGGFVAGRQPVIDLLRQRARTYLFSNALAPAICGASLAAIEIANSDEGDALRGRLASNAALFRARLTDAGFDLVPGEHPIIPVMLHDAAKTQRAAAELIDAGVLVAGFSYPVVPLDKARIRTQMSAELTTDQVEQAADIFVSIGRKLDIIA